MGKLSESSAFDSRSVTIAAGATSGLSGIVDLEGYPLVGFIFPTSWSGTALSFAVATATGGAFRRVDDDSGSEVSITVAAGRAVALTGVEADALAPWRIVKFRRGTATAAVSATKSESFSLQLKTY